MRRIIAIFLAALGGASSGYAAHQFLSRKDDPELNQQLVIGAPVTVFLAAGLLGLVTGRRGPLAAFLSGLLAATLLGTRLDDAIPGVADARGKAIAKLNRGEPAA